MSTGTSNWELPVYGIYLNSTAFTGSPLTLQAGQNYWMVSEQTGSSTGATPTAEPYYQTRQNKVDVEASAVYLPPSASTGCLQLTSYPLPSGSISYGPWNVVNHGTINPFQPINTRGIAFAICDNVGGTCGDALFPPSPSPTRTAATSASESSTPSAAVVSPSPSPSYSSSSSASATSSATCSPSYSVTGSASSSYSRSASLSPSATVRGL